MTAIIDSNSPRAPLLTRSAPVRLVPAAPSLWRVLDATGRVLGHIQTSRDREGVRFRARRFHATTRTFRELGEFWTADDAVDCLRYAR